jgi:ribosome-associated translation inhibitor RaiA
MHIELVLKGVELGRYARERIEYKVGKAVERVNRELPVRVVVEDHKGLYKARVSTGMNGKDVIGHHESRSVLEALDEAIVKFSGQVSKLSDRSQRKPRGRRVRKDVFAVAADDSVEGEGFDAESDWVMHASP